MADYRACPRDHRTSSSGRLAGCPANPKGLVIFAHGSVSGRFSPRKNYVARKLEAAGFATLLLDFLRPEEEADRRISRSPSS